jgi:hypothetical protein
MILERFPRRVSISRWYDFHETIGMDNGTIAFGGRSEIAEKLLPVPSAFEYGLSIVTPGGYTHKMHRHI